MIDNIKEFYDIIGTFVFLYPICMSILWCIAAVYFHLRRERDSVKINPYEDDLNLGVTVIIPAHNETKHIEETVKSVLKTRYPKYEIIVIDDASTDDTFAKVSSLAEEYKQIRVIHLRQNKGKAVGLSMGAAAARYEILLIIDADCILEQDAMAYMVRHFKYGPRVGAVTGNPRVRNRTTLLEKIQVAEYSSIIGLIKRSQRILGKVFTVSGAIVAFRKCAVFDVGLWDADMITDDINITWKLEKRFWDIRYETQALCWTMVPHSLKNLWKQRLRWAQGGCEVLLKHLNVWKDIRNRRFWPVYIEYFMSGVWAYAFVFGLFLAVISLFIPELGIELRWMVGWLGFLLTIMCLIQFTLAFYMDKLYEKSLIKYLFFIVWYAVIYWLLITMTMCVAFPKVLFRKKDENHVAVWSSPKRK